MAAEDVANKHGRTTLHSIPHYTLHCTLRHGVLSMQTHQQKDR